MSYPSLLTGLISPLATALLTSALALGAKLVSDRGQRQREMKSIAAGIAGELSAYLVLLDPSVTPAKYRALADPTLDRAGRQAHLRSFATLPSTHPVFEAVADKLGSLPQAQVIEASRIYNIITGMRLLITGMAATGFVDAPDALHQYRLNLIADTIEVEAPAARTLIKDLRRLACRGRA